jgi:hypothetical protein
MVSSAHLAVMVNVSCVRCGTVRRLYPGIGVGGVDPQAMSVAVDGALRRNGRAVGQRVSIGVDAVDRDDDGTGLRMRVADGGAQHARKCMPVIVTVPQVA